MASCCRVRYNDAPYWHHDAGDAEETGKPLYGQREIEENPPSTESGSSDEAEPGHSKSAITPVDGAVELHISM